MEKSKKDLEILNLRKRVVAQREEIRRLLEVIERLSDSEKKDNDGETY